MDQKKLRPAATLLLVGSIFFMVSGLFHTDRAPANDHHAVFDEYAASASWTAVHLAQFVGIAVIVAGLIAWFLVLGIYPGAAKWTSWLGLVLAGVSLALYGVLQGVDGVALKQAVSAWANASESERAARFASAEAIRWLEWGIRSYQSLVLGFTFVVMAVTITQIPAIPVPIAFLIGLTGLSYIAQGWVIGSEGFSGHNTLITILGYGAWLVWSIWLLVISRQSPRASTAQGTTP